MWLLPDGVPRCRWLRFSLLLCGSVSLSRSLSGPTELKLLSLVVIVPWNSPVLQNVAHLLLQPAFSLLS